MKGGKRKPMKDMPKGGPMHMMPDGTPMEGIKHPKGKGGKKGKGYA